MVQSSWIWNESIHSSSPCVYPLNRANSSAGQPGVPNEVNAINLALPSASLCCIPLPESPWKIIKYLLLLSSSLFSHDTFGVPNNQLYSEIQHIAYRELLKGRSPEMNDWSIDRLIFDLSYIFRSWTMRSMNHRSFVEKRWRITHYWYLKILFCTIFYFAFFLSLDWTLVCWSHHLTFIWSNLRDNSNQFVLYRSIYDVIWNRCWLGKGYFVVCPSHDKELWVIRDDRDTKASHSSAESKLIDSILCPIVCPRYSYHKFFPIQLLGVILQSSFQHMVGKSVEPSQWNSLWISLLFPPFISHFFSPFL